MGHQISSAVRAWFNDGGHHHFVTLTKSLRAVSTAASTHDRNAVLAAAQTLQDDTATARAYTSFPDGQAAASWNRALALLSRSANGIVTAITTDDVELFGTAITDIPASFAALDSALARITRLARHAR